MFKNFSSFKNISIQKAMIVSILTSFLLISRTLYNILAITIEDLNLPDFGFDWINVTDQVKKSLQSVTAFIGVVHCS